MEKYLSKWSKKNISIDQNRFEAIVAFSHEITKCDNSISNKINFTKSLFWLFGVDDIYDDKNIDHESLEFATTFLNGDSDELYIKDRKLKNKLINLKAIYDTIIWKAKLNDEASEIVSCYLESLLYGMLIERKNKFVDYDDYISNGIYTSGVSLLFAIQFFSDPKLLEYKLQIKDSLDKTALIIRILNDIKSNDKEKDLDKINSLNFYGEKELIKLANSHIEELKYDYVDNVYSSKSIINKHIFILLRTINILKRFYEKHDFHTYKENK